MGGHRRDEDRQESRSEGGYEEEIVRTKSEHLSRIREVVSTRLIRETCLRCCAG